MKELKESIRIRYLLVLIYECEVFSGVKSKQVGSVEACKRSSTGWCWPVKFELSNKIQPLSPKNSSPEIKNPTPFWRFTHLDVISLSFFFS